MRKGQTITWMQQDPLSETYCAHAEAPHTGIHVAYLDGHFRVVDARAPAEDQSVPAFGSYATRRRAMAAAERLINVA